MQSLGSHVFLTLLLFVELDAYDEVIALLAHNVKTTPDLEKNAGVCYLLAVRTLRQELNWEVFCIVLLAESLTVSTLSL